MYSMAEVLGIIASGTSVVSLAIKITENLKRAIDFCESIREAPNDIRRILLELQLLSNLILAIQLVHEKHQSPPVDDATLKQCLSLVKYDMSKLSSIILELERKLSSEKIIKRSWARVQVVLSEKKIARLRSLLEGAKGALQLLHLSRMS